MNILTEEEERELASEVIKMCPELSGIGRTADQYVRDPRTVQALKTRNTKLREALQTLAWQHGWGQMGKCVCEAHRKVEELGLRYDVPALAAVQEDSDEK